MSQYREMIASAKDLDSKEPSLRHFFDIPTFKSSGIGQSEDELTYLCGNSLGVMPKAARDEVNAELTAWADLAVMGHSKRFDGRDPWIRNDESVATRMGKLIFGCSASEIRLTGTLTGNLNSLLTAFYRPSETRYKIVQEQKAFPSDEYCFQNQVLLHGLTPEKALIEISPRAGEYTLRTSDILELIEKEGEQIAVFCLPAIQFYTGQLFDIPTITAAAHKKGCIVGWDLAHASGNVPLKLHEWNVDFAVFCSYKYLNCGPGNVGGLFVHDEFALKHASAPRPAGWWGVDVDERFNMTHDFKPTPGARGYCQSNLNFLGPACMHASLDVFEKAGGIEGLVSRREKLVDYMDQLLHSLSSYGTEFKVLTDELSAHERGSQLSLMFLKQGRMQYVCDELTKQGVIGDERKPNVIRLAPAPLYNTYQDISRAVTILESILANAPSE